MTTVVALEVSMQSMCGAVCTFSGGSDFYLQEVHMCAEPDPQIGTACTFICIAHPGMDHIAI